jgi:hypothetical protein
MFVSKERLWERKLKEFHLFGIKESNKGNKVTSEKWTNFVAEKTISPLSYYYV